MVTASAPAHRRSDIRLEVATALMLALATVFSTWSTYEAHRWGGVQAFTLAQAAATRLQGENTRVRADQYTQIDVGLFLQFLSAESRGDHELARFLEKRFRPELRAANEAWRATRPETNPEAPPSPFAMPQYRPPQADEADRLVARADQLSREAARANANSDSYVLLTVLFASVLFFGAVGSKFNSRLLRVASFWLGMAVLLVAVAGMSRLPVY